MGQAIKKTLSNIPRVTTNANVTFLMNDCSYVNINLSYPDVKFREYAPKNIQNLRILNQEANGYKSSFELPLNKLKFSVKEHLPEYYTDNNKYLIQSFKHTDFNKLIKVLPLYFSHICEHPLSLLPNIVGIYTLKYKTHKYYFIAISIMIPPSLFKPKTYIISLDDTYSPSERSLNNEFAIDYKDGLKLPSDINNEFMNILKNDTMFLKNSDMVNYTLLIYILPNIKSSDPSVTSSLKNSKNFALFSNVNDQNRYKKGMIVRQDNDKNLYSIIYIGIMNLLNKFKTWMKIVDGIVNVITTTYFTRNVAKGSPKDYRNQFIDFMTKYAVLN